MKVLESNETNEVQSGDISYKVTTNEKFIIITLQIKNITNYPISYTAREFMLMNINNLGQYDINNKAFNAMAAANGNEKIYKRNSNLGGVYDEVGPSIYKQTYIIFEVPKETSAADCYCKKNIIDGERKQLIPNKYIFIKRQVVLIPYNWHNNRYFVINFESLKISLWNLYPGDSILNTIFIKSLL